MQGINYSQTRIAVDENQMTKVSNVGLKNIERTSAQAPVDDLVTPIDATVVQGRFLTMGFSLMHLIHLDILRL